MEAFKEDFRKWYNEKYSSEYSYLSFQSFPTSMQWGVYVDFFEEHDIYPDVINCHGHIAFQIDSKKKYHVVCSDKNTYHALIFTNSKKGARETAIKKAIKIYNSNHAKSNKDT